MPTVVQLFELELTLLAELARVRGMFVEHVRDACGQTSLPYAAKYRVTLACALVCREQPQS